MKTICINYTPDCIQTSVMNWVHSDPITALTTATLVLCAYCTWAALK